jgi:phosphatidylinositol-3-phosphatase
MPPARPNRAVIVRLAASILTLVAVGVVAAAVTPRAYFPIVIVSRATVTATPSATATLNPSATPRSANGIPSFSHIFVIVLENHEYSSIIGNASAPYLNSLAQQYGLATNFYGIRHPSLPNYLAMIGGDTFGVTSDCTNCFVDAPNLVDQLEAAGKSWRGYMESMPSPCFVGDSGKLYRQKHNPFIYFDDIRLNAARCNKIVPFTDFAADLQSNSLPEFTWITPNMCNDMHDCSVATGDAWVQTWVSQILASPAWQNDGALFITFDEGSTNAGCCTYATGGQVVTLVISPLGKPAHQSAIAYDHYALLRTIENAWNLPELAHASCTCSLPMADFFSGVATAGQP